ncbi:MAG: lipid-A-disaccharide synthase [Rhizobiales bacterium]|nr:lipid-A-disaccharide synthase [Hyphomicrobiales bacterium]
MTDGTRLTLAIVAGEHSGDLLAGKVMAEINRRLDHRPRYVGVGGESMQAEGLQSLFPLSDVAVMGPLAIAGRLPMLIRRVYRTVDAVVAARPDLLLIVDSPEFTHPIAKRVRRKLPAVPIIDYVSPSVWAWRPGRARKMRPYVDHVLALLPFEPEAHRRLGGPACTYVGHPMIERLAEMRPGEEKAGALAVRLGLDRARPVLVVLPGSRMSEVGRLLAVFGEAVGRIAERFPGLQILLPTVQGVEEAVRAGTAGWPVHVHVLTGSDDKFAAFVLADAALAASGTVTLELGLAGVPMVVAYRLDPLAARLRFLVKVPSIVLANLVLAENAFPEFVQEACTPERLAAAVVPLLAETPERRDQIAALGRLDQIMQASGESPSAAAADVVLAHIAREGTPGRA